MQSTFLYVKFRLKVLFLDMIIRYCPSLPAAPILLNASLSLTAVAGSPFTLPCSVRLPDPSLSFQWLFNSQPLNPMATEGLELLSNGSLAITSADTSMEGTFVCVASNSLGTVRSTVVVNVAGKSEWVWHGCGLLEEWV